MASTKTTNILYWVSTGLVALFIVPGIFFLTSEQALEGIRHLGLPMWFHLELGIGKFIGGLLLILPFIPARIKEWAYVALGIDLVSAIIGNTAVDGLTSMIIFILVIFALLITSYITFHKRLHDGQ